MNAEKAGADAVLVVTPYYIKPSQRGLIDYFVTLGGRIALPMMIYHIPGRACCRQCEGADGEENR